jgi:hypothetical protein
MAINKSVRPVRRKAVLKVFPMVILPTDHWMLQKLRGCLVVAWHFASDRKGREIRGIGTSSMAYGAGIGKRRFLAAENL